MLAMPPKAGCGASLGLVSKVCRMGVLGEKGRAGILERVLCPPQFWDCTSEPGAEIPAVPQRDRLNASLARWPHLLSRPGPDNVGGGGERSLSGTGWSSGSTWPGWNFPSSGGRTPGPLQFWLPGRGEELKAPE